MRPVESKVGFFPVSISRAVSGMSILAKIGKFFKCFSLVNNLPHCRMMNFNVFGNGLVTLPRFMDRQQQKLL